MERPARTLLFTQSAPTTTLPRVHVAPEETSTVLRSLAQVWMSIRSGSDVIAATTRCAMSRTPMPLPLKYEANRAIEELGEIAVALEELEHSLSGRRTPGTKPHASDRCGAREVRFEAVIANLREGVVVANLDGHLLHFNRAALEMHGFCTLSECRRPLSAFADSFEVTEANGTVLPVDEWPLSRVLRRESLRDREVHVRHIHSDWQRVFSYDGALVRDEDGEPIMAIVTIRDVTERKLNEQRLRARIEQADALLKAAGLSESIDASRRSLAEEPL